MTERLDHDYLLARRASRLGAAALYGIAGLSLVIGLEFCRRFLPAGGAGGNPLVRLACAGAFAIPVVPLAEFLRHFERDRSPFGDRQFSRLVTAALLMGVRAVLGAMAPVSRNAASELAGVLTQADLYLKIISVVIFLVCLAMVVRYGDALKEDSDSIL